MPVLIIFKEVSMENSHKREHTKARIINKSLEFVKSRSLEDFSVREVSKELGINIASINYYFSNKENLLGEVVKAVWKTSSDKIESLYLEELEKEKWSFVDFFEKLFDYTHEISDLLAFVIKHTLNSNLNVDRNFVSIYDSEYPTPPGTKTYRKVFIKELGSHVPETEIQKCIHTFATFLTFDSALQYSNIMDKDRHDLDGHPILGRKARKEQFIKMIKYQINGLRKEFPA